MRFPRHPPIVWLALAAVCASACDKEITDAQDTASLGGDGDGDGDGGSGDGDGDADEGDPPEGAPNCEPPEFELLGEFDLVGYAVDIAFGDVDQDGEQELVGIDDEGLLTWDRQSLDVERSTLDMAATSERYLALLHADVDGKLDAAVGLSSGHRLDQFVGHGNGGFSGGLSRDYHPDPIWYTMRMRVGGPHDWLVALHRVDDLPHHWFAVWSDPSAVEPVQEIPGPGNPFVGDLDGDGIDELVLSVEDATELRIGKVVGDEVQQVNVLDVDFDPWYSDCVSLAIGHLDGDEIADIGCIPYTYEEGDLKVRIWRGLGGLEYEPAGLIETHGQHWAQAAIGDTDGDGHNELVATGGAMLVTDGEGGFACAHEPFDANVTRLGDVDGDGDHELAVLHIGQNDALVQVYDRLP